MVPTTSIPVGPEPTNVVCPSCHKQVITRIEFQASSRTHIIALILCLLGCCPCACCLYCTDCARDAHHYCPSCNAFLGVHQR